MFLHELSPEERKIQYEQKLAAQQQKISRNDFLQNLSPNLEAYLKVCPFIVSPELDKTIELCFRNKSTNRVDYQLIRVSWEKQVVQIIERLPKNHDDADALLWFANYSFKYHTGPIYKVGLGWVKNNFEELLDYGGLSMIAKSDCSAVIIIHKYLGYLETDPNPSEYYYEIELWGFSE